VPYLPNTPQDREAMLKSIGVSSLEDLLADIPEAVRLKRALSLPPALSEMELVKLMNELAESNRDTCHTVSFLGAGSYDHYIPAAVDHVISRSEFYTAYTPYQAEVSQGTLQAIYEYQSLICELTGMDAGNASMYDGASALAEAALLAHAATKRKEFILSGAVHPHWRQVVETYCQGMDVEIKTIPLKDGLTDLNRLSEIVSDRTACVVLSQPNFFGCIEEAGEAGRIAHARGALYLLACDPMSWSLLKSPAEYGADVAVAEGQPFGLPMSFGGPYLGIFAAKKDFVRLMPGRIVGVTQDKEGRRAFVLTLQTREQHIRREKATSNICTNEGLCALAATVYLTLMGKQGFRQVGELCLQKAHYLADGIAAIDGFSIPHKQPFFKEFPVLYKGDTRKLLSNLSDKGFLLGPELGRFHPDWKGMFLVAVTEKRTKEEMDGLIKTMKARHPEILALVLSMHDEALYAERALRAGARGYVNKQQLDDTLLVAIRRVLNGETYLSEKAGAWFAAKFLGGVTLEKDSPLTVLTDRELEVFRLIGQGSCTREIAQQLHLSVKTIESYREHIKQKLAQGKQQLVNAQAAVQIDDKAISSSMRAKAVDDEIVRHSLVTYQGKVVHQGALKAMNAV